MIIILVTTNRPDSISAGIAQWYARVLNDKGLDHQILSLEDLPADFIFSATYHNAGKNQAFNAFVGQISTANKMIWVVPEYNSSVPGILKAFLDAMPYPNPIKGKTIGLVGVSSGMTGNAIGLSHLTDILHYLGAQVLGSKPRLAQIHEYFKEGELLHPVYKQFIHEQTEQLLKA